MVNKNLMLTIAVLFLIAMVHGTSFAEIPDDKAAKKDSDKKEERKKEDIKFVAAISGKDPFTLPDALVKLMETPKARPEDMIALPSIEIQGLILNKRMPQAIINGDVKKIGDKIENFEIQEITKDGIVLFYKGKTYTIKRNSY